MTRHKILTYHALPDSLEKNENPNIEAKSSVNDWTSLACRFFCEEGDAQFYALNPRSSSLTLRCRSFTSKSLLSGNYLLGDNHAVRMLGIIADVMRYTSAIATAASRHHNFSPRVTDVLVYSITGSALSNPYIDMNKPTNYPSLAQEDRVAIKGRSGLQLQTGDEMSIPLDKFPAAPSNRLPLMIEGDAFCVGADGVCRTLYKLHSKTDAEKYILDTDDLAPSPFMLEEQYDLKNARKSFVFRHTKPSSECATTSLSSARVPLSFTSPSVLSRSENGVTYLGDSVRRLVVQEIENGVFGSAGTGSSTWEAAIAMALHFSSHHNLLLPGGRVLELGSGVGAGGILTKVAVDCAVQHGRSSFLSRASDAPRPGIHSMTLTDSNIEVLEQCVKNVEEANIEDCISIRALDWHNFCLSEFENFDDILVSDCIYLYPDVVPLAQTIASLCKSGQPAKYGRRPRAHIFAPYNRCALGEMVQILRDVHDMDILLDLISLERFRLKPIRQGITGLDKEVLHHAFDPSQCNGEDIEREEECSYESKCTSSFLYVQIARKPIAEPDSSQNDLSAID